MEFTEAQLEKINQEYDAIRDRIFEILDSGFINQKEFARTLGVSPQTITDWKTGKSRSYVKKLKLIATCLGVSEAYLWKGKEFEKEATKYKMQAAFWGGDKDLSQEDLDAMWGDVKRFAAFLAEQKKKEKREQ